jgi:hypothetical protein
LPTKVFTTLAFVITSHTRFKLDAEPLAPGCSDLDVTVLSTPTADEGQYDDKDPHDD